MSKKIWLIIAAALILVGCVIFFRTMAVLKWDFTKLSTQRYITNKYDIIQNYTHISVITNTADIVFLPSENKESTVVCRERENVKHSVAVKDGTLTVEVNDTRTWYEHIGITFDTPTITLYIPQSEYGALAIQSSTGDVKIPQDFQFESIDILENTGDVNNYASASGAIKIKASTGNIHTESIRAGSLALSVSTGRVSVSDADCEGDVTINVSTGKANATDVRCKNFVSAGDTGDISLQNVIAVEKFSVKRSTGDVKLKGCDATEIFIKTDTGSVTGTLLTEKVFITDTDTGSVDVPKTVSGGRCEITTDTGNIKIALE